ncbi:PD-(D/E)XK nuclease family protein [Niastella caeni]|uniref:PD-(D/E)XK nuclease family protein n=2 Tax=Niastella caeni TaxID=2569763 RepID=A0A4S8I1H9_9BACT|nr:PD-(D/E)XK nuclease family protein [Niastella caeni]
MMKNIGKISFKEIKRISPSQFYSMKNCAYKSLLAAAFENKPLLPISPNAYFGTVLHKMLELIANGVVQSENDFNRMFDEQVKAIEKSLQQQGYSFYVPLQKNVRDFGMKKILLKKHLRAVSEQPLKSGGVKYHSEKWFESKDKLIGGKIDLLIENRDETEVVDFKTGAITEDVLDDAGEVFSEVKEGYKEQLKLYAYLYFENMGKFPTHLSLVDLAKQKFTVEFSQSECSAIYEEAKRLLHSTNESIKKGIFAANPTEANCKYCLYRPACSFFLKHIGMDYSFNDVSGLVRNVVRYQNGNVSVFLQNGGKQITVTSFPSEKFDELNDTRNKQLSIYNLRKEATGFVYSATKTTMIYE